MNSPWTLDLTLELQRLAQLTPALTYEEIATRLGVGKNAVASKLYRLKHGAAARTRRTDRLPRSQRLRRFAAEQIVIPTGCRWPLGDPRLPGFSFCGAKINRLHLPYCDEHAAIAYVKVS
jgi:GcrA cell cycle regulator